MTADSGYSLLKKVPNVLRARGFRLYTEKGRRLVDLWLNGGAAVLGHTPPNILRELKNTASRGLYAPFPHFSENRYFKALSKLFPGYSFRLYAAPPPELEMLIKNGTAGLWRPFLASDFPFIIEDDAAPILVPVLPGIQLWRGGLPFGLCIAAAKPEDGLAQLPAGDMLPPVLLTTAARGLYDILASPQRAKSVFPRTFKALKTSLWRRQGIYLTLKENPPPEAWEALFNKFLEAGFLIPPTPLHPLILPDELSDGEDAKLAALFG
jgi:hypothetical protein